MQQINSEKDEPHGYVDVFWKIYWKWKKDQVHRLAMAAFYNSNEKALLIVIEFRW